MNWLKAGLLILTQIIAGIASAAVVSALFPGPLAVRTSLGAGTSVVRGLFIEIFLTFELIFTILMLAAEKHRATFIAPLGIGLALFIAELAGKSPFHDTSDSTNTTRGSLYRWFAQPSTLLWTRCCAAHVRSLPLDILDRSLPRRHSRGHPLPLDEGTRV